MKQNPKINQNKQEPGFDLRRLGSAGAILLALLLVWYCYIFFSTPSHIRKPSFQHYHFRTQIIINGQAVNFSDKKYQTETTTAAACSTEIGSRPIDFHDDMDQLTHIHWNSMTGGEFLKDYGWNLIGGDRGLLGWRFDNGLVPVPVAIYGSELPEVPKQTNFYIYTGDKNSYRERNWNDFLTQDLEKFFGKQSNIDDTNETSLIPLNWLFPTASAHGEAEDGDTSDKSEEELTRINNLVGSVVIFVQKDKPSDDQIKSRFDQLVPLHDSSCGD